MKIALLQTNIEWNNLQANHRHIESLLSKCDKADVYVLPEMFSTGFATNPQSVAETNNQSLEWLKQCAQNLGAAVCGSVAIRDANGAFYNRFYFVFPDGHTVHYDKRHLFRLGGEGEYYTRGNNRVVINYQGVRILLLICYDIRFPVFSRNRKDYDLIICVANWPTTRLSAWQALLKARAIENQCYVAGVNRCGSDPVCEYSGGTMLVDAYGQTIVECEYAKEGSVSGVIDLIRLNAFRQKFPVLDDADDFQL